MIDAGKAYNAANKQFVNGIRELAQQSTKDEVIEVRDLPAKKKSGLHRLCEGFIYECESPTVHGKNFGIPE